MNMQDLPASLVQSFERQRAARAAAPAADWATRADRLKRLQRLLHSAEAALVQAIDADFGGRPAIETQLAEGVLEDARAIARAQAYRTGRLHDGLVVETDGDEVRVVSTAPYSRCTNR